MRLYDELTTWYRLLSPVHEYVDEAAAYWNVFASVQPEPRSFLELGAGAGHNAFYLKTHFSGSVVLTDLSPRMLELSAAINNEPNVEHIAGDMRTLRLEGRTFDCVLVHDAVAYMTTEADLRKAIETAFVHTRPGGVAIFAPDYFKETLDPSGSTDCGGGDSEDGQRGVRYLEWVYDPNPDDDTYLVDYALLLRDGEKTVAEHDRHVEGIFSKETWKRLFSEVGYEIRAAQRPRDDEGNQDDIFLLLRPQ